jgi:hypothetical protein
MRLPLSIFVLVCSALAFNAKCGPGKAPVTVPMQSSIRVLRFPEPWSRMAPNGERTILTAPELVVRRVTDAPGGDLLFAAQDPSGAVSENIYEVSLDDKVAVRQVNRASWQFAQPIVQSAATRLSRDSTPLSGNLASYNGKSFAKSGGYWSEPVGIASSAQGWLTVLSYNTNQPTTQDGGPDVSKFIGGGEPGKGDLFVDIYDSASGEKVLSGYAPFTGAGPSLLLSNARWLDDSFFVMPLDSLSQTCLLASLPKNWR